MALSKLWSNWAVRFHCATAQSGGAVDITGILDVSWNPGLRTMVEAGDGNVYASFGSLVAGAPVVTFRTTSIKQVLDSIGVAGMLIDSGEGTPGVELYQRRMASGGTRDAYSATTHHKTTIANGIAVVRRISAQHQGQAVAEVAIYARQAGSTAPLVYAEGAAHPNVNVGPTVLWTLGAIKLNSTLVEGLESLDIDLGVDVLSEGRDGDIYPSFCSVRSIRPTIRARTAHIDATTTLGEDGASYSASQVLVALRKRAEGGTLVATGTEEHILLTLGKCRAEVVEVGGDPKMLDMLLTPWATIGTTDPITVDTTGAYPTAS